jgi:hypothetical protein
VTFVDTSSDTIPYFGGDVAFGSPALFGAQSYCNFSGPTYSDLAIVLAVPVPAVGAWVGQSVGTLPDTATMLTVAVFDGSDILLEQTKVALPPKGQPGLFVGFARPEGIGRVEWQGGNTGFFCVDNITFNGAVPEPSAVLLLAGGLALVATRRRCHF